MFITIELLVNLLVIWLIANLVHYWFFKDRIGGGIFCLSNRWKDEEQRKEKIIKEWQEKGLDKKAPSKKGDTK